LCLLIVLLHSLTTLNVKLLSVMFTLEFLVLAYSWKICPVRKDSWEVAMALMSTCSAGWAQLWIE
jgi:hypothetical protein